MFGRLKKLLVGGLRKQLIVGMALIVASMMSMFVWDITRRQQIVENRHHSEQASALADSLARSSAIWVLSQNFSGLQEIVKGISLYPNLRYAIVLSLKGQVLAHSDPTKVGLYMSDLPQKPELKVLQQTTSLVDVASPIMLADKQIGWVRIGLDRAAFNAELAKIAQSSLVYTLIAIILSVFFASLAALYLTRRLYAIQRVADAVQAGDASLRAIVPGDDEAARLARQFNDMLDTMAQREQQLRSFYELDLVGLAITSPEKGWVRINNCLCKMLEYSEQELHEMTWPQLTHPEDLAANVEQFNRLLTNEIDGYRLEKRFISRTGKIIPTNLVVGCARKPNNEIDYVTAMVEDISERKQLEEERRVIESRLNLALEFSEIGVWDLDLIEDTAWRSLKHDQIFGYESMQPKWGAKIFMEHLVPEDREVFSQCFEEARH